MVDETASLEQTLLLSRMLFSIRYGPRQNNTDKTRITVQSRGLAVTRRYVMSIGWLSFEEEERLLKASPKWLQEIIVFAISTGLCQSEILDLKWSQVDIDRRTVTISEQKNHDVDTLPLNGTAMAVLRDRLLNGFDLDSYVFPNTISTRKGNRDLMKAFYVALKKSGVRNFRFHDLRHTFATRLIQSGVDLYTL